MQYHRPQTILAILLLALSLPALARGQNCKRLAPAGPGQDDAARINQCLATKGRAKLTAGTFLLYDAIVFPGGKMTDVSGVTLIGKGMDATRLVPQQADCQNHWPFVEQQPGQYKGVIQILRSPAAVVHGLEIDLVNLRRDCGYGSENAITVNRSPNSEVSQLRVKGSRYGDPDYTSGGANWGGIFVVNSENPMVTDNEVTDVAFTVAIGGTSAGHEGIFIQNSANAIVQNNRVTRVAFGIEVVNGSPSMNYTGDSSGTIVANNTIIGAANINCPECSQGRAIKLQACGVGDELPLNNLTVRDNDAREFGGANNVQGGSGLDLVCGVRYSTFERNRVLGAATAEFGLQIRSSFLSPANPTHHNRFNANSFASGRGQPGCNNQCSDVNFTPDGPDQIGIQRNGFDRAGTNTATTFRYATDRGCTGFSHAFMNYVDGGGAVRQGQPVLLAAANVRPNTSVTFRFLRTTDNQEVARFVSQPANRNCVMNQEYLLIDPALFTPGTYQVKADYKDGNSDATITDDTLDPIKVKAAKSN
ncbi:MAG TPA: hypothetical protein VKA60_07995 [Blastocatellia bacterium]|nr:hypothetical protein [Blastocatellia bacterium]